MANERKALIFHGGWPGHQPETVAKIFANELKAFDIKTDLIDSLECLNDAGKLTSYAVIVPCWTDGKITNQQSENLSNAVKSGVGLAGAHGMMGDSFHGDLRYEWMVGGHFVGHPYVGEYSVRRTVLDNPILKDFPDAFIYKSEQYYMLIDPAIDVLADSIYVHEGKRFIMPIVWTRQWEKGRVFYSALGDRPHEFTTYPHVLKMTVRGILWAANLL